ncbi:MAG: hypothetical protein WDN44_05335 [Sphingomonas sp.]
MRNAIERPRSRPLQLDDHERQPGRHRRHDRARQQHRQALAGHEDQPLRGEQAELREPEADDEQADADALAPAALRGLGKRGGCHLGVVPGASVARKRGRGTLVPPARRFVAICSESGSSPRPRADFPVDSSCAQLFDPEAVPIPGDAIDGLSTAVR